MMSSSMGKKAATRREYWRGRIAEQERSGQSVQTFCKAHSLTEQSFYLWRKRLREQDPVRFAVLERGSSRQQSSLEHGLELVLTTGERLRIGSGVDAAMLRAVLEALRA
jgi:hypothetical protein